jgi:hypothetical protein
MENSVLTPLELSVKEVNKRPSKPLVKIHVLIGSNFPFELIDDGYLIGRKITIIVRRIRAIII